MTVVLVGVGAALLGFVSACGGEDPVPLPDFEQEALYATLQEDVATFAYHEGDYLTDFGDGAFFGLAFHARAGATSGDASLLARADEAAARNLDIVLGADLINGDVNEIIMSALGLIEYQAALGGLDASAEAGLSAFIDDLASAVEIFDYYLDGGVVSSWAVDTYGPTSISALVALVVLQQAWLLDPGPDEVARRVAWARAALASIDEQAHNGRSYDFGDGVPGMYLYPNVSMIIANLRMYQLTGEAPYLERAQATHDAIQDLRLDDGPGYVRYRSPYSQEDMGAQTDDYSTLSSQNYTLLALLLFYEVTDDARYVVEYDGIVRFLADHLYGQYCRSEVFHGTHCDPACGAGQTCLVDRCFPEHCQSAVLHHWMDGAIAVAEHDSVFCAGCNLQLLYVLWYRQFNLGL
jgi:hypothetical protein